MATDADCPRCAGDGWVCEDHPDQRWLGADGEQHCGGAGMPCVCNTGDPPWQDDGLGAHGYGPPLPLAPPLRR